MSRISLSSNPSGTGVVTIASPATNIDRTLTLPDASGSVNVSGTVNIVPAGSASTPSISPDGDTNTGIFFPAPDTVAYATGGVEHVRIDSSGRVGIGTSSPDAKFDVRGYATFGPVNTTEDYQGITLINGKDNSASETVSFIDARNNLVVPDSNIFFVHQTDGGSAITFGTTPPGSRSADRRQQRMKINSIGNITTPAQPSIYLDGNNGTQINFTAGQQLLTSTYFQQKHIRGGMSWNGTTGAVTVPTAGHYFVSYAGYENVSTARVVIAVNGANVQLVHWGGMGTRSISFVVSLAANDYLQVIADAHDLPQLYMGPVHNYFCVYLLG